MRLKAAGQLEDAQQAEEERKGDMLDVLKTDVGDVKDTIIGLILEENEERLREGVQNTEERQKEKGRLEAMNVKTLKNEAKEAGVAKEKLKAQRRHGQRLG